MTNSLTVFSITHNYISPSENGFSTLLFFSGAPAWHSHSLPLLGWQREVGGAAYNKHLVSGELSQCPWLGHEGKWAPFSGSDLGSRRPKDTTQVVSVWLIQSAKPAWASQVEREGPRCLRQLTPTLACSSVA